VNDSHRRTWTIFSLAFLFVALVLGPGVSIVEADNGPHGGYTATTDACAGCHRAHTAGAPRLLLDDVPNLCYTCHGSGGNGADTNVVDGIYLERDLDTEDPAEGIAGRGLKGGGFVNALMDTDWDGAATSAPTTSSHRVDGSTGTAWGNGEIGSGPGTAIPLSCTSCHDPHGRASTTGEPTYRLLRAIPINSGASTGVDVEDETDKVYTVSDTAQKSGNQYFGEDYGSRGDQLSEWCSQCHTRYLAPGGSGSTDSGDPIFAYRHLTQGSPSCSLCHDVHGGTMPTGGPMFSHDVTCVTCHVAHGTSASMGGYAGNVEWPDGATDPSGNNRSSLLRVDNRGTCQLCHGK